MTASFQVSLPRSEKERVISEFNDIRYMTKIDKSKPVLVTGANGYVASWLVKRLMEEGLTVHAAVRDPESSRKLDHLEELADMTPGNIRYFKADLLDEGSYTGAMEGCELVYHTASPFTSEYDEPLQDLVNPAVKGTQNVLESANQVPSVKRVVVTSSCAAIYTDASECLETPQGALTEDIWNTTASLEYQPYSYSKTLAEKSAWEINREQQRWDMIAMNPCLIMGPPLNPHATTSESFSILKQLGDGTLKIGAPRLGLGLVDVRDVAEAHFRAGFNPDAKGRYITAAHNTDLVSLAQTLRPKFGDQFPLPKRALPKWLLILVGPMVDERFSRRFIRKNVNKEWRADNSKIRKDLNMEFRPLRETMEDAFQVLVDEGIVTSR